MSYSEISESAVIKSCAGYSRSIQIHGADKAARELVDRSREITSSWSNHERDDRMVLSLLPLVRQVAAQMRRHLPAHVEMSDLIQEGVLGLVDALTKFDVTRHVKIESYARHRIRGAILDSLRRSDPASRDARRKAHQVARTRASLEARLGRQPTGPEMANELKLSLEQWYKIERQIQLTTATCETSLDQHPENQPRTEASAPAGQSDSLFEICYRREQQALVKQALSCLGGRDRTIITLYYHNSLTMKEIGQRLGVDESRVSQLHSRALSRLKACVQALARPTSPLGAERP